MTCGVRHKDIIDEIYEIPIGPELDRITAETVLDWKNRWCPEFSTDISAMWRLREVLCKNYLVTMSNGDGDSADVRLVPFNGMTHSAAHAWAGIDQMPAALCRAALMAERTWRHRETDDKWSRTTEGDKDD